MKTIVHNTAKWCTGISILFALLLATGGANYFFLLKKNQIAQHLTPSDNTSGRVQLNLSLIENDPSFEWEGQHEFFYQGKLFDVIKRSGNQLFCLVDNEETSLYELFRSDEHKNHSSHTLKPVAFKLFACDYTVSFINYCKNSIPDYSLLIPSLHQGFPENLSHPPESIL